MLSWEDVTEISLRPEQEEGIILELQVSIVFVKKTTKNFLGIQLGIFAIVCAVFPWQWWMTVKETESP